MIETLATEAGIEMRPPSVLANSYLALQAQEFAIEHQRGDAFEERVFRAYFHDGANIGDLGVVRELAARCRPGRGATGRGAGGEPLRDAA